MTNLKGNPLQLQSTKELKSVMQQYFSGLKEASSTKKHRKVAWCSSIGPCELLIAMPSRLNTELGIPTLIIDGDLNDLRCFSEEQAKTNIEAFVEQLEEIV